MLLSIDQKLTEVPTDRSDRSPVGEAPFDTPARGLADIRTFLGDMARHLAEPSPTEMLRDVLRVVENFALDDPAAEVLLSVDSDGVDVAGRRSVWVVCMIFAQSNSSTLNAMHIAAALAAGNHVLIASNGGESAEDIALYRVLGAASDERVGFAGLVARTYTPAWLGRRFVAVIGDLVEVDDDDVRVVVAQTVNLGSRRILRDLYSRSASYRIGVSKVSVPRATRPRPSAPRPARWSLPESTADQPS